MEVDPVTGGGYDPATTKRATGSDVPPGIVALAGGNPAEGGSGSGGTTPSKTGLPDLDWASAFFGSLGLPADVAAKINEIFSQYNDTASASAAALAYIRGTPWYDQTFPGIKDAMMKGIVSNEGEYRSLLNQQNQLYRQYLGRDISGGEYASNLGEGANLNTIGGRLQGAALANTYGNDWRYKLGAFGDANGGPSPEDLKALGEEQAGLDSPLGQVIKQRLDMAQQRFQKIFEGSLARPSLSLASGRLSSPGLTSTLKGDVGA